MKLTDLAIRNAKPDISGIKQKKLSDGKGLYLLVHPNGSKYWRFRKVINGRETTRAIGTYPAMSLSEARIARDNYLAELSAGIDPLHSVKPVEVTFEEYSREWHARKKGWNKDHSLKVMKELEKHVFPILGDYPVKKISTQDLLIPLRKMEENGILETAARVKQRMNAILRYAVQSGLIKYNPAQELNGTIETRKTSHHPALPPEKIPDLLQRIKNYHLIGKVQTQLAVKLNLIIFIRSSEMRLARWNEIDFKNNIWTIPAQREEIPGVRFSYRGAKMKTPHIVPLPKQAVDIINEIKKISGEELLIFPGDHYQLKPMSENTINKALRNMGFDTRKEVCGHGFRAMACSALTESGRWSREAVERQMSHQERNTVRAAYVHQAEFMEERRLMLQWWADYLDACATNYVSPYRFKWVIPEEDGSR